MAVISEETQPKALKVYLQDHLAGSVVGVELVKRCRAANRDNDFGAPLARLEQEIADDRGALKSLMEKLGVEGSGLKNRVAWIAEKAARLKPNGEPLTGYSDIARLIELEGLYLGVTGKLSMWEHLRAAGLGEAESFRLDELIARASSQQELLTELKLKAAKLAFAQDH